MKGKAVQSAGKRRGRRHAPAPVLEPDAIAALDALSTQIAILDAQGRIRAVNKAWCEFNREVKESACCGTTGSTYLTNGKACARGVDAFKKLREGARLVVRGVRNEFLMEYPCPVSAEERWFRVRVRRISRKPAACVIVIHEDIGECVQLEREILAASARERQRFGQELHDGLSQQLTGLKFKASLLQYQLQSKQLPEARDAKAISDLLNQATEEASWLARGVQSIEAAPGGLMMALKALAANTSRAHGLVCGCEFRRPVLIADHHVATHVYRIAEEALANAVRHGHARHVSIALDEAKDGVTLIVRDDGDGIPEGIPAHEGAGLHLMRYRARSIAGSIELHNHTGGGATMTLRFRKRVTAVPVRTSRRRRTKKQKEP